MMQQSNTQIETLQGTMSTFSQALDFVMPIVMILAVLAVLAALIGLIGLFLTDDSRQKRKPVSNSTPRRAGQGVPVRQFHRHSAKRARIA